MKTYNIPEIADVTETLALVSNVKAWSDRLKEMHALEKDIKADIAVYGKHVKLDEDIAKAKVKLIEADAIRKEADTYVVAKKTEADKRYAAAVAREQKLMEESAREKKSAEEFDAQLAKRASELDAREKALDGRAAIVAKLQESVKAEAKEVDRLRSVYNEKLAQIKAVAGE